MSKFTFARSKRHNIVEVAINYECLNDRKAITHETAMLQELSRLMASAKQIHDHGTTPVEPNITMVNNAFFMGAIDLKFPIKTKVEGSAGLPVAYSFPGLHAVLVEIQRICTKYRDNFTSFSMYLNLAAMTAPWVLPIKGNGVIMRRGSARFKYTSDEIPAGFRHEGRLVTADDMYVVGEYRAVQDFTKRWARICREYHAFNEDVGSPQVNGPNIDVDQLRVDYPAVQWQNIAVFVRERNTGEWVYLGTTLNEMTLEYAYHVGSHMLQTPMGFDNDATESTGNVFLHDHDYYEFQYPVA